mmetsp:Transcript_3670/g.12059  ORF Transcript_3670/g.12059 Transcript_3670/m.12059 type:complete len:662 (-) Transcript_3670:57-2042(-)
MATPGSVEAEYRVVSERLVEECASETVALPTAPYYDVELGSLPGPDRVETKRLFAAVKAVVLKAAKPERFLAWVASGLAGDEDTRRFYGRCLAFEVATSVLEEEDDVRRWPPLVAALEDVVSREAQVLVGGHRHKRERVSPTRQATAAKTLPLLMHAARRLGIVRCALPFASLPPLSLTDRSDFWSKFYEEHKSLHLRLDVPPPVEFGEKSLEFSIAKSEPTYFEYDDDDASLWRRDSAFQTDVHALVSSSSSFASGGVKNDDLIAKLRSEIPKVALRTLEDDDDDAKDTLRDWSTPAARVLGWSLAVVCACRLADDVVEDAFLCGHAIPTALSLMDAYDDQTRIRLGMATLARALQVARPSQITGIAPMLYHGLQLARNLSSETGQHAALHGRLTLRFVALLAEPKDRAKYAVDVLQNAVKDLILWRREDCRIECLRWRLSPAVMLHVSNETFDLAPQLRAVVPALCAILKARAPGAAVVLALRSLHALAVLCWPRFRQRSLLQTVVPAALLAAKKAFRCLTDEHAYAATLDATGARPEAKDQARTRVRVMVALAPNVLNTVLHFLAFLVAVSADHDGPDVFGRLQAECTPDLAKLIERAKARATLVLKNATTARHPRRLQEGAKEPKFFQQNDTTRVLVEAPPVTTSKNAGGGIRVEPT